MKEILERRAQLINGRLEELMGVYTEKNAPHQLICAQAMKYSLAAGGKRIRPVLATEFARIFGGSEEKALDSACALENYAFEVISSDEKLSFEQRIKVIKVLSEAVGVMGMIGGQTVDVQNVGKPFDAELLLKMYSMKTSALIKCACVMGCICAERYDMIPAAEEYAEALGLAFQIVDDILDITADEKLLGKPVHSDADLNKATYPAVFGLDAAEKKAEELTAKAVSIAESFPDSDFLSQLTAYLLKREY